MASTTRPNPGTAVPRIAVLISCYTAERLDLLVTGIEAARGQLRADDELIVVVDHNPDLLAALRDRYPSGVTIEANTHSRGLSGARNTGVGIATAEIVAFLDDDAALRPGALDAARCAFTDPTVVAVGGAVHAAWESGSAPTWFPDEFGWVVGCDYRGLAADGAEIRNPIGAAMAVRRAELVKIGGFSDRLGRVGTVPAGCEETLMGIELRRRFPSSRIVRTTAFAVDHVVPDSRATLRYFSSRCRHEGRSKAVLSDMVGADAGLSAERSFVVRTLSSGVLRYLRQSVTGGGLAALGRILVLVFGLVLTATSTAAGAARLRLTRRTSPEAPATTPLAAHEAAVREDELVTVVVPTVGRDSLIATANAVLAQDHPNIELIVVDNRPHRGGVRQMVAGIEDPRLRVIDQPVPGVSAARNIGHQSAAGRIVAFTDDDALPDRDWVSGIVRTFRADPVGAIGLVTGRVLGTDATTREQEWFEEAKVFDKGPTATVWAMRPHESSPELGDFGARGPFFPYTAGECGSGNNMAFRSSALESIGGFDERLGTGTPTRGGEDLDSFRATLLRGWSIAYNPDAVVRHYHRDNMADLREQSYGYGTGMAASLAKFVLSGHAIPILARFPRGLHMLFSPNSAKNVDFPSDWPLQLRALEAWGYVTGPILFVRSHLAGRRTGANR
ncbi:glycosyltransferase family 2 protein [Rhodococcus sp. NPDC003318]|uniref:glycosyltransferase family 2 protein n=1 Tax=Rhodococcus sp. NPDC003318 TaxID=3364503 RepID=UPI0036A72853